MPVPTPFHPRTSALCESYLWKDWGGYHAVRSFDTYFEREYFAFRHAAGLIDVTALYKLEVRGPDAGAFLSRMTVRDAAKIAAGRVVYCCWCDEAGEMIDDGTILRFDEEHFRVTSTEPPYAWFQRHAGGYRVEITDVTDRVAALSLQGPTSRDLLAGVVEGPVADLKFFRFTPGRLAGKPVLVSRTGYTGDLGYEIWAGNEDALAVWDALAEAGPDFGMLPAGLDAMDMTRIEAGFLLNGVDYYAAHHCFIESRKSSPYEMGLGWMVKLDRDPFLGQQALQAEKEEGSPRAFVGLEVDWVEVEALFARVGLPPEVHRGGWRDPVPVYNKSGRQVGYATSGSWSPILKKNLALATVESAYRKAGTELEMEVTVEYRRERATARVAKKPFFDPERKRS